MTDRVTTRIDGPIAYVTLTRAEKLNGLDLAHTPHALDGGLRALEHLVRHLAKALG